MYMLCMLSQEVLSVWYDPTYFNGQVSHTPLPSVSTKEPTQKTQCQLKWFRCKVPRFSPFFFPPLRIFQVGRSDHRNLCRSCPTPPSSGTARRNASLYSATGRRCRCCCSLVISCNIYRESTNRNGWHRHQGMFRDPKFPKP